MAELSEKTPLDVPAPENTQKVQNSKIEFYLAALVVIGLIVVVAFVSFYLGRQSVQSKVDEELTASSEVILEKILLPSEGLCGQISDIWTLDFSQLDNSCDLSLVEEVDDMSLDLSYITDNNIGLRTALFTFDYPVDIDSSKIASIDLNFENVFCNGSVSILYSSNDGYKKWTRFKNSTDFYSCGLGGSDMKNIKMITMQPEFVNNQVKVVFTPYASAHPFSVDKISLVIKYKP